MIGHPTPEPAVPDPTVTTVLLRAGGPSRDAAAALVDLVCADRELLAAEFDAIVAANFPDVVDGPRACDRSVPALTGADLVPPRRARHRCSLRPPGGAGSVARHPRPRERGPPRATRMPRTGWRHNAPRPIGPASGDRACFLDRTLDQTCSTGSMICSGKRQDTTRTVTGRDTRRVNITTAPEHRDHQ